MQFILNKNTKYQENPARVSVIYSRYLVRGVRPLFKFTARLPRWRGTDYFTKLDSARRKANFSAPNLEISIIAFNLHTNISKLL